MALYFEADGLELVSVTIVDNSIVEDLLSDVMLHLRVSDEEGTADIREQDTLRTYIGAAIEAVENYLQKDLFPRDYELTWHSGRVCFIECGEVRSLALTDGESPSTDLLPTLTVRGSRQFRGAGLKIYGTASTFTPPRYMALSSGFLKAVQFPAAVRAFIFAFVGMLHENREMSNVGTVKYQMDEMPTYLLDPLKSPVLA